MGQVGVKLGDNNSPLPFKLALIAGGVVADRRRPGAVAESRSPLADHEVDVRLTTTIYVGSIRRVPRESKRFIFRGSEGLGPEKKI